jgi:ATP-dependent DNA helicase RecQ
MKFLIHLENYIQEAGRAGRDENITADCFVLFNEEDLGKHFILLNQTKLSIKEIQQVWKAIKDITRFRSSVSNSALEIARKAGWDDNVVEIETRVTTAIAALEDAGYLKRGQNMPRVFANSILSKTAQEAIEKINASQRFERSKKKRN